MKSKNKKNNPTALVAILGWKAPLAEKEALTRDDAKFIFDQAEKLLNDSVVTSETIVSRMNTLITLITASLLAIFGFIISKFGNTRIGDPQLVTAISGGMGLYI